MKPRHYQTECVEATCSQLERSRSVLIQLATGTGKTLIMAMLAKRFQPKGMTLVLAHREELIRQNASTLQKYLEGRVGVEKAEEKAFFDQPELDGGKTLAVCGSVQTLMKESRLVKLDPKRFSLIITDEAHHAPSRSYRGIYDYFLKYNPQIRHVGPTATPVRHDRLAMGQVFERVAYTYTVEDAIADGYLVPVRQAVVRVEGLDLSAVAVAGGDFVTGQLEKILDEEKTLHRVVVPTLELVGDRQAIVFAASVQHGIDLARVFCRYRYGCARALSAKSDEDDRKFAVEQFRRGQLQFLVNCGLFLEGFDARGCAGVVMARPTLSKALYEQMMGRGTRVLDGTVDQPELDTPEKRRKAIACSAKRDCLVVDFVGNSGRHKLIQAADILGGRKGSTVCQGAKELSEDLPGERSVDELLELSESALGLFVEEEERKRVLAKVRYQTEEVSPFSRGGVAADSQALVIGGTPFRLAVPATEKQAALLRRFGFAPAQVDAYSKETASWLIEKLLGGKRGRRR